MVSVRFFILKRFKLQHPRKNGFITFPDGANLEQCVTRTLQSSGSTIETESYRILAKPWVFTNPPADALQWTAIGFERGAKFRLSGQVVYSGGVDHMQEWVNTGNLKIELKPVK
jgi:hypothetical protein